MTQNGHQPAPLVKGTFPPRAAPRLARLFYVAEGAKAAAQAAANAAQQAELAFRGALQEECAELEVQAPPGRADTSIDFKTGAFAFYEAQG